MRNSDYDQVIRRLLAQGNDKGKKRATVRMCVNVNRLNVMGEGCLRQAVTAQDVERAKKWAEASALNKDNNEDELDQTNRDVRDWHGQLGHVALDRFLSIDTVDWTIGDTRRYDFADLIKVANCGVKTATMDFLPLIGPKVLERKEPQIMALLNDEENMVYFLGVFSTQDILEHSSSEMFVEKKWNSMNKIGFWGYDVGLPMPRDVGELIKSLEALDAKDILA
jgi:hypothetical protein